MKRIITPNSFTLQSQPTEYLAFSPLFQEENNLKLNSSNDKTGLGIKKKKKQQQQSLYFIKFSQTSLLVDVVSDKRLV